MKTLNMTVTDKLLVRDETDEVIICGNGDYQIQFAFDAEWNAFPKKTARFTWNGRHEDVEFNGNTCVIPMLINTGVVTVGVYAGEGGVDNKPLATTKVPVYCVEGSRCGDSSPNPNTGENYTNQAKGYAANAKKSEEAAAKSAEEAKAAAEGAGGLKLVCTKSFNARVTYETADENGIGDATVLWLDGERYTDFGSGFNSDLVIYSEGGVHFTHVRLAVANWCTTLYTTVIELPEACQRDGYVPVEFEESKYVRTAAINAYHDRVSITSETVDVIIGAIGDYGNPVTFTVEFYA